MPHAILMPKQEQRCALRHQAHDAPSSGNDEVNGMSFGFKVRQKMMHKLPGRFRVRCALNIRQRRGPVAQRQSAVAYGHIGKEILVTRKFTCQLFERPSRPWILRRDMQYDHLHNRIAALQEPVEGKGDDLRLTTHCRYQDSWGLVI